MSLNQTLGNLAKYLSTDSSGNLSTTAGTAFTGYTNISLDGSNTVSLGARMALLSTAGSDGAMFQLNVNNGFDIWFKSSGTWNVRGVISKAGEFISYTQAGFNGFTANVSATSICYLANPSTTSDKSMYCQVGGVFAGSISHPTSSTTAFNTSSDYRLKDSIQSLEQGLEIVMKLKPSHWIWNTDGFYGEGFIAHEVQELVPLAVTGLKDAINKEGNPEYQSIDASKLIPYLTKAIQELKLENDNLKEILSRNNIQ